MHRVMSNVIMMSQNLSAVLQVYELLICQNTESILQNDSYYSIMCLTREPKAECVSAAGRVKYYKK